MLNCLRIPGTAPLFGSMLKCNDFFFLFFGPCPVLPSNFCGYPFCSFCIIQLKIKPINQPTTVTDRRENITSSVEVVKKETASPWSEAT